MRKFLSLLLALSLSLGLASLPCSAVTAARFRDVPRDNWSFVYVEQAAKSGWVSGVDGGIFAPDMALRRADVCVMLSRMACQEELTGAMDAAAEYPEGSYPWWAPYTAACRAAGLLANTAMEESSLSAEQSITRLDMAVMLSNLMEHKSVDPGDTSGLLETITDWRRIPQSRQYAVLRCYAAGLFQGDAAGRFHGDSSLTRAQVCVVLCALEPLLARSAAVKPVESDGSSKTDGTVRLDDEAKPDNTEKPDDTVKPNNTEKPDDTVKPNNTEKLDDTVKPDDTSKPKKPVISDQMDEAISVVPRPSDAIGGRYDTQWYTVPSDTNKDGWITLSEVNTVLESLQREYPEGTPWGMEKNYFSNGLHIRGQGCAAWAFMVSDAIFGNLPMRTIRDPEGLCIGDMVSYPNKPHRGVFLYYAGQKYVSCEGNVDSQVFWGLERNRANLGTGLETGAIVLYTRYPAE